MDLAEVTEEFKNPARGWYQIYTFEIEKEPDFEELKWCLNTQDALALVQSSRFLPFMQSPPIYRPPHRQESLRILFPSQNFCQICGKNGNIRDRAYGPGKAYLIMQELIWGIVF